MEHPIMPQSVWLRRGLLQMHLLLLLTLGRPSCVGVQMLVAEAGAEGLVAQVPLHMLPSWSLSSRWPPVVSSPLQLPQASSEHALGTNCLLLEPRPVLLLLVPGVCNFSCEKGDWIPWPYSLGIGGRVSSV